MEEEQANLHLPQLTCTFSPVRPAPSHLLILGGRAPDTKWLQKNAQSKKLWAIDHGVDACRQAGLCPMRLIGDNDSATVENWQWCEENHVPIHRFPPEKDLTDTQLALQMLAEEDASFALITGAFGGRMDHAFSTIHSCAHASVPCCLADEQEVLFFLKGVDALHLHCIMPPKAISLLPLTSTCTEVCIDGVHWPLQNTLLRQDFPFAISNVPDTSPACSVSLQSGILGVYLCFGAMENAASVLSSS